jgi:hypothetical protein
MKIENIEKIISKVSKSPKKWELDELVYFDRDTNPDTLLKFFNRIRELKSIKTLSPEEKIELKYLTELLSDMDEKECLSLLNASEEESKTAFIENLARTSAIEMLTSGRIGFDSMNTACKLSPNDFILCAKRTQDLLTAIQGLVIKGETLSKDIAGA